MFVNWLIDSKSVSAGTAEEVGGEINSATLSIVVAVKETQKLGLVFSEVHPTVAFT